VNLDDYAAECRKANDKWWRDPITQEYLPDRNIGELLMLCVSELSEAMEGHRKGLQDDKLPHRSMLDVELVDCLIRIFDLAGERGIELQTIYREKMEFNANRHDHTYAGRLAAGGKKY
jgi:NTP pyrophosphatase (non-canonical NTP hydrolase)